MAYTKKTWEDFPNTSTPITADDLNNIEDGIEALDTGKANLASPTFTGTVILPSTTSIGNVSSTELGYVDGVTSSIQGQLNVKAPVYGASSFDCNTIKDTSFRGAYSCPNGPTNSIGVLQTMSYSVDWVVQVYWVIETDTMYVRRWTGGTTWSSWVQKW